MLSMIMHQHVKTLLGSFVRNWGGKAVGIAMLTFLYKNLPLPPAIPQYKVFFPDLLSNFMVFIQMCAFNLIQGNDLF